MRRLHYPTLLAALLLVLVTACGESHARRRQARLFTDDVRLRTTPVRDQGPSELCWIYAMLATIESEHIEQGDSLCLSPDFLARRYAARLARTEYLAATHDGVHLRGTLPMTLRLLAQEGAMNYDAYHARQADYNALCDRLTLIARRSPSLDRLDQAVQAALDEIVGAEPQRVYLYGATYTTLEFAHSLCHAGDYEALTSFSHHLFYQPCELEIPDNRMADTFTNVPIDTLMARIDHSLRLRRAVAWEGDISEDGFRFDAGTADLERPRGCSQEERQHAFSLRQTTDDHAMALIGIAHDEQGRKWYIAKNSWGTRNPYGGLMYLSADYVRMKTIAVVVHRE